MNFKNNIKNLFHSSKEDNLSNRLDELISELVREYYDDEKEIRKAIKLITSWVIIQFDNAKLMRRYDDLLELDNLKITELLDIYNDNELYHTLIFGIDKNLLEIMEQTNLLKRNILLGVLYELVEKNEKKQGYKYAFIFAKMFHLNLDVIMKYRYSDDMTDDFIDNYLKSGGSRFVICYPKYNLKNDKDRYSIEDLDDIIRERHDCKNYIKN